MKQFFGILPLDVKIGSDTTYYHFNCGPLYTYSNQWNTYGGPPTPCRCWSRPQLIRVDHPVAPSRSRLTFELSFYELRTSCHLLVTTRKTSRGDPNELQTCIGNWSASVEAVLLSVSPTWTFPDARVQSGLHCFSFGHWAHLVFEAFRKVRNFENLPLELQRWASSPLALGKAVKCYYLPLKRLIGRLTSERLVRNVHLFISVQ